jgi:hypothetical protein
MKFAVQNFHFLILNRNFYGIAKFLISGFVPQHKLLRKVSSYFEKKTLTSTGLLPNISSMAVFEPRLSSITIGIAAAVLPRVCSRKKFDAQKTEQNCDFSLFD